MLLSKHTSFLYSQHSCFESSISSTNLVFMKLHLFSMHGQNVLKNLPSELMFCWQISAGVCLMMPFSLCISCIVWPCIMQIVSYHNIVVNMLCFFIKISYILASTVWITARPQGHLSGGKTSGFTQVNRYNDDLLSLWKLHSYCLLWCLLLILSLTVIFQETATPTPSGGEEVTIHLCTINAWPSGWGGVTQYCSVLETLSILCRHFGNLFGKLLRGQKCRFIHKCSQLELLFFK